MGYDKEIRRLLDLYFKGESTLEQENLLKEFFAGNSVPGDLEYARAMFGFFTKAADERMSGNAHPVEKKYTHPRSWIYKTASAAAVVAIALVVTLTLTDRGRQEMYCYVNGIPVTDTELAVRQAEMAVRILEGNMKASAYGLEIAGKAGKSMEKALESVAAPE